MRNTFLAAFATFCGLLLEQGSAATHDVDCDAGEKIQEKISLAKPGDTILVTGICTQSVEFHLRSSELLWTVKGRR